MILTIFGESHGVCIGCVLDGCPAGLDLTEVDIQKELDKRKPSDSYISTSRREPDCVEILSGLYGGRTTGAPICMITRNRDVDSRLYEAFNRTPRPGHADYPSYIKYHGYSDERGGGRFSGRITVAFVMAGAVAKKLLSTINIQVLAHTIKIGKVEIHEKIPYDAIREKTYLSVVRCADSSASSAMEKEVLDAKNEGDSIGGVVEGIALNVPVGFGNPVFGSLDSEIAEMLFSIPGVKGVEFGAGFRSTSLKGSENNDQYGVKNGRIILLSNNSGGVLGGLSSGMPLIVRVAFKPTPSISKRQKTVDLRTMKQVETKFGGRHDPCIVPRAVPVVESCLSLVLADHAIMSGKIPILTEK